MQRLDQLTPRLFLDGPTEFLVKTIAAQIALVPQFSKLFGDSIAAYERLDFSERELPALRIYNLAFTKESEDWFINGDVKIDIIWPAQIRRTDLQQLPDTITSAFIQQFRRTSFFNAISNGVPGLNELGKILSVNKELGFQWGDNIVPLTQITVNFRLDLRAWDYYMESQGRTEDDPFEVTLQNLDGVVVTLQGLREAPQETLQPFNGWKLNTSLLNVNCFLYPEFYYLYNEVPIAYTGSGEIIEITDIQGIAV